MQGHPCRVFGASFSIFHPVGGRNSGCAKRCSEIEALFSPLAGFFDELRAQQPLAGLLGSLTILVLTVFQLGIGISPPRLDLVRSQLVQPPPVRLKQAFAGMADDDGRTALQIILDRLEPSPHTLLPGGRVGALATPCHC